MEEDEKMSEKNAFYSIHDIDFIEKQK